MGKSKDAQDRCEYGGRTSIASDEKKMKWIATLGLLVVIGGVLPISATAQSSGLADYEKQSRETFKKQQKQAKKTGKKQAKLAAKAVKKQQKAMKKQLKEQERRARWNGVAR